MATVFKVSGNYIVYSSGNVEILSTNIYFHTIPHIGVILTTGNNNPLEYDFLS